MNCSSDDNALTKEYILEHVKQIENKNPIIRVKNIPNTHIKLNDLTNTIPYYANLYKKGYLTTILRTDIPNPETSNRPYKVILTKKAAPFIVEKLTDGYTKVKMFEFNATEVLTIKMLSDFKAEIDVLYKKTKTPFYYKDYDVSTNKNKPPKGDLHTETLQFNKNSANEWKHFGKILF